jgi:hypothetical protein
VYGTMYYQDRIKCPRNHTNGDFNCAQTVFLGIWHSEILDPRGGQVGSSSGTFRAHSVQLGSDEHQCESQVVVIIASSYIVSFNKKCLSCQINHFISIFL